MSQTLVFDRRTGRWNSWPQRAFFKPGVPGMTIDRLAPPSPRNEFDETSHTFKGRKRQRRADRKRREKEEADRLEREGYDFQMFLEADRPHSPSYSPYL